MRKEFFLLTAVLLFSALAWSQSNFPVNTLTPKGAWCWFADPRALNYSNDQGTINSTYIGYIDVHGNIKATQINHLTQTTEEVLIRSYFQPDDHNNPTFLILPDERVMIFYSRHTDEPCFYYRVSKKPGDITTLGQEVRLETSHNTTYPSPFILSDDPDHIYLCWRGIGWHPTIARLTLPDENDQSHFNWGPYQIVRSRKGGGGTRPYAKYVSNGKDRIYLAYTTTHPDNQSVNYLYFNSIDIKSKELKDIKGTKLSVIGESELHDVDATTAYKQNFPFAVVDDTPARNWLWEVTLDKNEFPVIAQTRISEDKSSHEYYHVRWDGNKWQSTFLAQAGGAFHQSPTIEKCYSAGMTIDKNDPRVIYGSVPVKGKFGTVYEIKKFTVDKPGTKPAEEQLTFDSAKNNSRPFAISNKSNRLQMGWMYGEYYDWIVSATRPAGYPTAIHTNMDIPQKDSDISKGLLANKPETFDTGSPFKSKFKSSGEFTIALDVYLNSNAYFGDILRFGNFSYTLPQNEKPKPMVTIGKDVFHSTNVLGSSDIWQTQNRGTGGHWYAPTRFEKFHLTITCKGGIIRTYINGCLDQYIETSKLKIKELLVGEYKGQAGNLKVYNRALSQSDIKQLASW